MNLPVSPQRQPTDKPVQDRPAARPPWAGVSVTLLVLGCAAALLIAGNSLADALLGAGGMAVTGGQVAHRIVTDPGHLPAMIVASAIAIFGAILLIIGYELSYAAMGAGMAGLVAGEVARRLIVRAPRREV
ncbi:hypothetical protein [Phytohabitans suffuscus]|uniref:hypothetical protein n=1 Tax=Phytohabitans suffuscus TaxID=624315 RepID=UPI001565FB69|nr:hypothetical protein [Phytohabitans suffuscus]